MRLINMSSDAFTLPTPEMRLAMASAEVAPWGHDATVAKLEELAARLLSKEAALFIPTGTQGNLIALLVQAPRNSGVIVEAESHIRVGQESPLAELAGIHLIPVMAVTV